MITIFNEAGIPLVVYNIAAIKLFQSLQLGDEVATA